MITKFKAQNFQSLQKVELDLEKFTVVVGPSSSGKSALIRALRILAHNSNNASFVTHGRKAAIVTVEADKAQIILERGPGKSIYTLVGDDGKEAKLTKCGTSAPEAVGESTIVVLFL